MLSDYSHSFPRVSLRQSVSRDSRQCRDYAEIVQSEQVHLWKDNGYQQVHQERGATGVQAAHPTDSQDGELHIWWHVVINCCHAGAFCPLPHGPQDIEGTWFGWLEDVCHSFRSSCIPFTHWIGYYVKCFKTNKPLLSSLCDLSNHHLPRGPACKFGSKTALPTGQTLNTCELVWCELVWVFL